MEDYKLKVFCTVAEVKSFSKASEIIHLTQPAVSAQIQVLEDFYGTKLFDRTTNNVSLTPTGEILYKYAKDILSLYADAEKNICRLTGLLKGSIRLGASAMVGNYLLPELVFEFLKNNSSKMKVNLRVGNTKKISDLLNSSNIDIGIVEGEIKSQKIVVEKLYDDELVIISSKDNPISKLAEVGLENLMNTPFIVREDDSGTRQVLEKLFSKYGSCLQNLKINLMFESIEAIKEAVIKDFGIALESKLAIRKEIQKGSIKAIKIKGEKITRPLSVIYRKKGICSHIIEEFICFIKNYNFNILENNINN
ncbi:transcriptional regulator, LysR family [Candidatus Magnetoovum chiemensis]|nr:transcriptional regulator, LysR family [Candidatus Magnetoovum chiemensis]